VDEFEIELDTEAAPEPPPAAPVPAVPVEPVHPVPEHEPEHKPIEPQPVAEAAPAAAPKAHKTLTKDHLVLSLCGGQWARGLLAKGAAPESAELAQALAIPLRVSTAGDRIVFDKNGRSVPNLLDWAGNGKLTPAALAQTRRLGVTVEESAHSGTCLVLNKRQYAVAGLAGTALNSLMNGIEAASKNCDFDLIIPEPLTATARDYLTKSIAALSPGAVNWISEPVAIARSTEPRLAPGELALVLALGYAEMRLALVRGQGEIVAARRTMSGSLWAADRALAERGSYELMREYSADVRNESSLWKVVLDQVSRQRRTQRVGASWELSVAGGAIEIVPEVLADWLLETDENLLCIGLELLEGAGVGSTELECVVLCLDEPAWPSLAENLQRGFGCEVRLQDASPSSRLRGALAAG